MAVTYTDYYADLREALRHNTALTFPLRVEGDSWLGALCTRHQPQARKRFGRGHGIVCLHPACPARCAVCAGEFAPRSML